MYDLAVLVLTDAGLDPEEYWLDGYLDNVIVYNPLPVVTHKEALQIIAKRGQMYNVSRQECKSVPSFLLYPRHDCNLC